MTGRDGSRSRWRWLLRGLVYLGAGIAVLVERDGLVGGLHAVTGGSGAADVVVGVLAVWAPLVLLAAGALLARRWGDRTAGWLRHSLWLFPLPWVIALALTPYGRAGTDEVLLGKLQRQLPGFTTGLVAGFTVLAGPVLIFGLVRRARDRWDRRASPGALRRGDHVRFTGAPGWGRPGPEEVGSVRSVDGEDVVVDRSHGRARIPMRDLRPLSPDRR